MVDKDGNKVDIMKDLIKLEGQCQKEVANGSFKLLDILHHFSSGIKALVTGEVYNGMDELRQACGGAGFILSSGIADQWAEQGPFPTFEGVNVIMYQQSSRMLLKQAGKVVQKKAPHEFFSYMANYEQLLSSKCQATTVDEFLKPETLAEALAVRACFYTMKVFRMLSESKAPSKTKQNELFAIEVNRMTKLHLTYIIYTRACNIVKSMTIRDENVRTVLIQAFGAFALKELILDMAPLYESGYAGRGFNDLLEASYARSLNILLPVLIGSVFFLGCAVQERDSI